MHLCSGSINTWRSPSKDNVESLIHVNIFPNPSIECCASSLFDGLSDPVINTALLIALFFNLLLYSLTSSSFLTSTAENKRNS